MERVTGAALDGVLSDADTTLSVLFLWGRDCPNCDIAKRALLQSKERLAWPQVRWLQDNVYEDLFMATKFGLHGIPVFFVFGGTRKLGRITGWPGLQALVDAIEKQWLEQPVSRELNVSLSAS